MLIAGEASGDRLGAVLVREIAARRSDFSFFGTPGSEMRTAGVESLFNSDDWSIVGVGAVAKAIPRFLKIRSELRRAARERRPAAVVLIDFPEFNLKFAGQLKRDGHTVIYYVSPQVWAWRQYRSRTIRESVDLLLSILPFEKQWYAERGIGNVEYVGSPVVGRTASTRSRDEFIKDHALDANRRLIALLPGSRIKEIRRHLRTMVEAAGLVDVDRGSVQFAVAAANDDAGREIKTILSESELPSLTVVVGETIDLLNASDAAAISSGTATLEAGIIGTPMTVVYKIPKLDYQLFRPLVDVPHFALINLIAGRKVAKELIQDKFTARTLATELNRLIDPKVNQSIRAELSEISRALDSENPSGRAAETILKLIDEH
jgi:lipid-A-disaccharide synthase